MKPLVLHVITALCTGGAQTSLHRLIVSPAGQRYRHTVVALTTDDALLDLFRNDGIEVILLDFRRAPLSGFIRLLKLIRRLQPDIVQTWMYHADLFGGIAARLAGNRNVIWGIHTTLVTPGSCSPLTTHIRSLCAWLSRWVPDTIVSVADAAQTAHARLGYHAPRMTVIHNGFNMAQLVPRAGQRHAMRMQCAFDEQHFVIGTVGRFNADKDQRNFVRAAGMLAGRFPQVRFLMVGPNLDTGNPELMRWIGETGYADRFVLLGQRNDVPACMAAMEVFCLSSRNEAFPNVVGEAMAAAVPCVATDVGDVRMLVADTGIVVPKENSPALAQGLEQLVTMPEAARRHLGLRAQERIRSEFSMERVGERFGSIYERLLLADKLKVTA